MAARLLFAFCLAFAARPFDSHQSGFAGLMLAQGRPFDLHESGFAGLLLAQDRPARTPDIHFTPTRHAIADAMLQLAGVTANDTVYDLGSGDGRIPIIAAQKYGATAVGVEIDPRLVELAWRNANDAEVAHRVKFVVGDLFETDFSNATVVTMYLSPSIMNQLAPKLRSLKPGTRIVSHQFPIRGWPPDERRQVDESELLLWRIAR